MNSKRLMMVNIVLAAALVFASIVQATPLPPNVEAINAPMAPSAPTEAWEQVSSGGANTANNATIIAMRKFGSYLYAGTFNTINGASLLRSPDGTTWAPIETGGFGVAANIGIYSMIEYKDRLYVGTRNATGAQLWSSPNGEAWTEATNAAAGNSVYWTLLTYQDKLWVGGAWGGTAELWIYDGNAWTQEPIPGFDAANQGIFSLVAFQGDLYAGVGDNITGAEIWRRDAVTGGWERIVQNGFGNPNNDRVYSMIVYENKLYAGTYNPANGAELYVSSNGVTWEQVFAGGFDTPNNAGVRNMLHANGYFYLAAQNDAVGGRVYRTTDGRNWTPVSLAGFGDAANTLVWGMAVFETDTEQHLYVGTANNNGAEIWRTGLPQPEEAWMALVGGGAAVPNGFGNAANNTLSDYIEFNGALYAAVANAAGAQVWRSWDGRTWTQVGTTGFGDVANVAAPVLAIHNDALHVGTVNANGARVYRLRANGVEWEAINEVGFGAADNDAVFALVSYQNALYAGTRYDGAESAKVYRYTSGTAWSNVTPTELNAANTAIRSMAVHGGNLYMGTENAVGSQIWRWNGSSWSVVDSDGQGKAARNGAVSVLYVFDTYLYAGYENATDGGEIWRSQTGDVGGWTQVNNSSFGIPAAANTAISALMAWDGYLYAGTANNGGGQVWRTAGGATLTQANWEQVNTDGFSFTTNRVVSALQRFGPHLYAGTTNANGAEVWRTARPDSGPGDPCCQVVEVGIEVQGACWIRVNRDETVPLYVPNAGIYDIPLEGPGTYDISVEYVDGNEGQMQSITVVVENDGTVRITHGATTPIAQAAALAAPNAPTAPQEAWQRVATPVNIGANNLGIVTMRQFGTYLYASTENNVDGVAILRTPDGMTWSQENTFGFGNAANTIVHGLTEYAGSLYAGTVQALGGSAEMWRSADGRNWTEVENAGLLAGQSGYWSLLVYNNLLWVGTDTADAITAQLLQYSSNTGNWTPVTIPGFDVTNTGIYAMVTYQNDLYIGTRNAGAGAQIWRRDHTNGSWSKVAQDGLGNPANESISVMTVYNNVLYVGTQNAAGAELYATRNGFTWERIFDQGLGEPGNVALWQFVESNGYLYLGTQNNVTGGRVYRTVDGNVWTEANVAGFGNVNNTRAWGMATFRGLDSINYLYVGTRNATAGAEIWRTVVPQPQEAWLQVARRGINNVNNTEIWSMVEYDDAIYIGTRNSAVGGQVWKSIDGRTWVQVGLSGLVGDATNVFIDSLAVHNGKLYAGVDSGATGARVYEWDSAGAIWRQINDNGFGTVTNQSALALLSFNNRLYATTYAAGQRASIWVYDPAGSPTWTNVSPPSDLFEIANTWVDAMAVFDGRLYIGTLNATGAEIWRYDGSTWQSITTDAFGRRDNVEVQALQVFDGYLYAGFENGVNGGQVWRSQTGDSGTWTQVNQSGFGRATVDDPNNRAIRAFGVWQGYLYAGTANGTTGGEVWRTAGGATLSQAEWTQVNTDGFGWQNNTNVMTLLGYGKHIYAGTANGNGAEIWRTGLPGGFGARFATIINVGVRTDGPSTLNVTGPSPWTYQAPGRGIYAVPLPETGLYRISCGCGEDISVYLDTTSGHYLDSFTFDTIANQIVNHAFPITINAKDEEGNPIVITTTTGIQLTDSTGTINPVQFNFTNKSSHTISVTIGITATNVVITATYNTVTGASNSFNVTEVPAVHHFTFALIPSPQTPGVPFDITITAEDSSNNTVASYNGTANLTINAGGLINPTSVSFTNGVANAAVSIRDAAEDVRITATTPDGLVTGRSNTFNLAHSIYLPLVLRNH